MRVVPVPCLKDNYAYLVICEDTGEAAVVDPSESAPVEAALRAAGAKLRAIWCTHHHLDHVGGNAAVAGAHAGIEVVGHASDDARIPALTRPVEEGDEVTVGNLRARVIHNPGHTRGAVSYVVGDAVFTGDTLFLAGCGRLFEGTPATMHASLEKLAALPPGTRVYCGHEYTASNLKFAAAVEPDSRAVRDRRAEVEARGAGASTVPATLAVERATNPFLRVREPAVVAAAVARGARGDDPADVFAKLRAWKDSF